MSLISVFLLLFFSLNSAAQEYGVKDKFDLPESMVIASPMVEVIHEQERLDSQRNKYKVRFVPLSTSVIQDVEVPFEFPKVIHFKGDFKNITEAVYLKKSNAIRFTPIKEGQATLTVTDIKGKILIEYRVEISKNKLDHVLREIRSLLSDIEGIQIKILNSKVVIDGQVLIPRDVGRIYTVVTQYGDQATSLVTLAPNAQKKIAEIIAKDINNPEIQVRAINEKIILEGVANSQDEKDRAEIIAKLYLPGSVSDKAEQDQVVRKNKPVNDGIINFITIRPQPPNPPNKLLQLVLHFVELRKDYSKNFLFQFMPSLEDGSQITFQSGGENQGSSTSITGIINNLLPKLNWGKEHGYARVIESSTIIVQDTKTGVLNSTIDIPFTIQTPQGPNTTFKQVGFKTQLTPVIVGERSDLVNLTIAIDISSPLDTSNIISSNSIQTDIAVRSSQSAAFAGLIRNISRTDFNKNKPQVQNPIISLNANRAYSREQGQFVVFITPVIKSSASQGSERIKRKFRLSE